MARDLVPVVFLKPHPPFNAGEIGGVPARAINNLVKQGKVRRLGDPGPLPDRPAQGTPPSPATCGACGEIVAIGAEHLCRSLPRLDQGVFDVGFTSTAPRRKNRRGRGRGSSAD